MGDWLDIRQGDALLRLREMPTDSYDAVISDPPYASGGMSMSEKAKSTRDKYTSYGEQGNPYPDFSGDALAQRAWTSFMHEILVECRRVVKPSGVIALFIDWRQLPALTDAMQWAGWVWRGIAVWDKITSRPQRGRFRQQAEFIVWASKKARMEDPSAVGLGQQWTNAHHQGRACAARRLPTSERADT